MRDRAIGSAQTHERLSQPVHAIGNKLRVQELMRANLLHAIQHAGFDFGHFAGSTSQPQQCVVVRRPRNRAVSRAKSTTGRDPRQPAVRSPETEDRSQSKGSGVRSQGAIKGWKVAEITKGWAKPTL